MKSMLSRLTYITFCLFACAFSCNAAQKPIEKKPNSVIIDANVDKVWPAVMAEIANDYSITSIDKSSGLIVTDYAPFKEASKEGREGVVPPKYKMSWYYLKVKLTVMVMETDLGKTKLTVNAHYEGVEGSSWIGPAENGVWQVCESTGVLENKIVENIRSKLVK